MEHVLLILAGVTVGGGSCANALTPTAEWRFSDVGLLSGQSVSANLLQAWASWKRGLQMAVARSHDRRWERCAAPNVPLRVARPTTFAHCHLRE